MSTSVGALNPLRPGGFVAGLTAIEIDLGSVQELLVAELMMPESTSTALDGEGYWAGKIDMI
jgi:hypothetical protein